MTERERSGIASAHELALRQSILVTLAALVLLCCVGCVSSTPDRGGALERRDIVSTAVAATLTGVAVATSHPTFTATPVPTATVVPTPTPLPALTLSGWAQEVDPQIEIMVDAMQTMAELQSNPLFGDATWTALLADQAAKIREADAALRGIVPPEECREAHAMMLAATNDWVLGAEYGLEGVQQLDPNLIRQAIEYVDSGRAKLNLSRLMLEALIP